MTVRAEQQLVTAPCLQPEFRIEILRDGEVGHDEMEAVQRVDAEFARAPVGFDVVVDRRHRRSSSRSPRTGLVSLATRSFAQMQADDKSPQAASWVTGLTRIPIFSISTSTRSPGFMNSGGLRLWPTPEGVPVTITSPASQRHRLTDRGDQRGDIEHHVVGRGVLQHRAVEARLDAQALGARRQFVGGDERRTERAGVVKIFADRPLRRLELIVAHRGIVEDRIAGDMVERLTAECAGRPCRSPRPTRPHSRDCRDARPHDRRAVRRSGSS